MNHRVRSASVAILMIGAAVAGCSAEPSAPPATSRAIAVSATDEMRFDPAVIDVAADEAVRFEITNVGELQHEFFVGDAEAQDEHAREMAEAGGSEMDHSHMPGVTVEPGQTAILDFTFDEAGKLLGVCHEPGHYEAGMIAEVNVN